MTCSAEWYGKAVAPNVYPATPNPIYELRFDYPTKDIKVLRQWLVNLIPSPNLI